MYRPAPRRQKNKHELTEDDSRPGFQCDKCPRRYANQLALRSHRQSHGSADDDDKKFVCELCKCKFATRRYLYKHKRRHLTVKKPPQFTKDKTSTKPHACTFCSKSTYNVYFISLNLYFNLNLYYSFSTRQHTKGSFACAYWRAAIFMLGMWQSF